MSKSSHYYQARDSRWKTIGSATADGACLALSTWWIIQTSVNASQEFWDWLAPPDFATGKVSVSPSNATQDSNKNLLSDSSKGGKAVTLINSAMANQGLAIKDSDEVGGEGKKIEFVTSIIEANSTLRAVRESMKVAVFPLTLPRKTYLLEGAMESWAKDLSAKPGYKYISFRGNTTKTANKELRHGIAVFTGHYDSYWIFDPNFGEYSSDTIPEFTKDLVGVIVKGYDPQIYGAAFGIFQ